ncbi:hypothetical protein BS47DRAFT_1364156 [Hydnum rufescens UP504]|uniref:Uncharacterized protein n=1 Tax=Hydnum rufescens UP504 TaxID=1448309 RepID=A0A9P6DTU3_9AGAM|nr:hypothetical protein BS47DRAFT_1364156 [Hydnum rufescens UP504]
MRKWTAASIAEFEKERQHYLTQVEQPPLPPWESFAEHEKVKYLASQREKVIADEFSRLTVGGWALGKRPRLSYRVPISGLLHLPRGMNGKEGFDKVRFKKGDDLNDIVYNHYDQRVDPDTWPGTNYVASEGIIAKRSEYLGPNPHVASYRFTFEKCEIEWWEPYLEKPWIGETYWLVESEFDETVRWWFPMNRSVY